MKAKITVILEDGSGCTFTANNIHISNQKTEISILSFGVSGMQIIQPDISKCGKCQGKAGLPCDLCNGTGVIKK